MKQVGRGFWLLLVLWLLGWGTAMAAVVVVDVRGEIDAGQVVLVRRALADAERQEAALVVNIDTFGGLVDAGTQIRDLLIGYRGETVCFVNHRAWSAGALIAIACKKIYMTPEGSRGAAEPIPATEKTIAALKAEFSATALKTGRNPQVAEAMVDKTMGYPGVAAPGQILALNSQQAVDAGYSVATVNDLDELLAANGWGQKQIVRHQPGWGEKVSGWLADPAVKSILVGILVLAVMTEIKAAGWGAAAVIGGLAALLLFAGQWLSGVAEWWNVLLVLAGLGLLLVEMFVASHGLLGAAGLILIFAGLFFTLGADLAAAKVILYALLGAVIAFLLIVRWLPTGRLWRRLALTEQETSERGFVASGDYTEFAGGTARVRTTLRPAGTVELPDGSLLDVVSEGSFIPVGTTVKIIRVDGGRVVVRPLDDPDGG
ncbi:MAG: ATP-dependent Clp protease proteolytic subunit [Negativicutes bacterium]|nr:ATP-dependent Clp protease proteolytic subunit [Negativicutes bacterium]